MTAVRPARVALDALLRIDTDDAYANLVLPPMLDASRLDVRDRAFVTELVYGTTRMRRACDWAADRFVEGPRADRAGRAQRVAARLATSSCSSARLRTRRWPRRSIWRPSVPAGWSTRCCARSRPSPCAGPTRPRGSAIPTGWWPGWPPTSGADDALGALRADERGARGGRARRRLRAGSGVAVGGGVRRRPSRRARRRPVRGARREGDADGGAAVRW